MLSSNVKYSVFRVFGWDPRLLQRSRRCRRKTWTKRCS